MNNLLKLSYLLGLGSVMILSACQNDDESSPVSDTDTEAANDNSFAEATFDDAGTMSDQAADDGALSTYRIPSEGNLLSSCATVTNDITVTPHILTIDFGPANCLCKDGKNRRGKIIVSYSGNYRDSASSHTISFSNYYVNNFKVTGSKTVTNQGHNANGHLYYSISVNGIINNTSGQTLTWNSNRTREWTTGELTFGLLGWLDDVYSITGSVSGTSFNGTSYTAVITSPLIVALDCKWINKGKFEFTPSGKATRVFDYGNGTCDNKATVTISGVSYNITLR